jgi:hypothetical protein
MEQGIPLMPPPTSLAAGGLVLDIPVIYDADARGP